MAGEKEKERGGGGRGYRLPRIEREGEKRPYVIRARREGVWDQGKSNGHDDGIA